MVYFSYKLWIMAALETMTIPKIEIVFSKFKENFCKNTE